LPYKIKKYKLKCEINTTSEIEKEYDFNGKTKVLIGPVDDKTIDFKINDADFKAIVYGRRGCPFNLLFKKAIMFKLLSDKVAAKKNKDAITYNNPVKIGKKDRIIVSQGASFMFVFRIVKK